VLNDEQEKPSDGAINIFLATVFETEINIPFSENEPDPMARAKGKKKIA